MAADCDHLGRKLANLQLCALFHRTIALGCRWCGHTRYLDAATLWWLFETRRWDDSLREVPRRFWCKRCGRRARQRPKIEVSECKPVGPQFPYPDERVWKRLQARYRS